MKINYLFIMILFGACGCSNQTDMENKKIEEINLITIDPHSYAKPETAKITHLHWQAEVNFNEKTIYAIATFTIKKKATASEIILDTKNLSIEKVWLDNNDTIDFRLGITDSILGQALYIPLKKTTQKISIKYRCDQSAEALQWLSAQQTSGGNKPFLFTQSQAILCRSWIPIQDSPNIRFSYNANVKVPEGFLALMSASNPQQIDSTGNYSFEMKQAIPAYLMALAVGDLQFKPISARSGVYAESSVIDTAAAELEDLERMITAAEQLYGAYRWERFDVLFLPASFPFGGMENPRLTFATPTILAGDKSLVSLIAHELAHSWSGNLVTNATWNDFWLNEGFTVYFEYRIMEALYGKDYADMLAENSYQELKKEVDEMLANNEAKDTHLKLNLINRSPDDGMNSIAYDKGYFFLKTVENIVGREKFDSFLNQYFNEHAFKSMHTEAFLLYLEHHLFGKYNLILPKNLFSNWIYGAGLPTDLPIPNSEKFNQVDEQLSYWSDTQTIDTLVTRQWSTHEWLHFFGNLPDSISAADLNQFDNQFEFTLSSNAEIQFAWYLLAIQNDYRLAYPAMEKFLINTGRRKFLVPLYSELIKSPSGKATALNIYKKARPNYHFVSYNSLDKLLNYQTK